MKKLFSIAAILALTACATPQELPIHPTVTPITPHGLKWANQYSPIAAGFSTGCAGNVVGCPGTGGGGGHGGSDR